MEGRARAPLTINLGLALANRSFGASARDLIGQRNSTLVAVATAALVLMTAIFALPQEWALFAFGTLHGHDAAPVAIVAVVVVALLETIKRFWLVRLVG